MYALSLDGGMRLYLVAALAFLSSCVSWPDRQWERIQARNPALQQIDSQDWQTWLWHGAITVAAGHALALTPWVDQPTGMRILVAAYFAREVLNRTSFSPPRFDYRYKPLDGIMDVAVPFAASELTWRVTLWLR